MCPASDRAVLRPSPAAQNKSVMKGSLPGISLPAPWNFCARGKGWDAGGRALQHQSHRGLETRPCKKGICTIFLSAATAGCQAGFLRWKANSSASPQRLLSDGRSKSQEIPASKLLKAAGVEFQGISASVAWLHELLEPSAVAGGKDKYSLISSDFELFGWFVF